MNDIKKKINTIGKVCHVLSVIVTVLCIVATSTMLIAGVVLSVIPQDVIRVNVAGQADVEITGTAVDEIPEETAKEIAETVTGDSFTVTLDGKTGEGEKEGDGKILVHASGTLKEITLRRVGAFLCVSALIPACLIAVFFMLGRLMKALSVCDSPFCESVVKSMTYFAISLFPFAVIKQIASSVSSNIMLSGAFRYSFGVDLTVVFTALVILLLAAIFKYGTKLQKESDETL